MKCDVAIVGAGIVGLATAYAVLKQGVARRVLVLEKEAVLARHQTGRNSGVVHSGIYYKPGSQKVRCCVRGRRLLVDFCNRYDIPFRQTGKLIVACDDAEVEALTRLERRGRINGLKGLRILDTSRTRRREPYVRCLASLFVPETGIVDFTAVAECLKECIVEMGGEIVTSASVENVTESPSCVIVESSKGEYLSSWMVNCGGLYSDKIALMVLPKLPIRIIPFRGEYFRLLSHAEAMVRGLIYPVPNPVFPFLGIHLTRNISGHVEAGPNAVFALKREGYSRLECSFKELWESISWPGFQKVVLRYWKQGIDELATSFSKSRFAEKVRRFFPLIEDTDLVPGESGVRAQACGVDGRLLDDFFILHTRKTLNVLNAPSPAATSALAIGEEITARLGRLMGGT